jgi:hypothetical protein
MAHARFWHLTLLFSMLVVPTARGEEPPSVRVTPQFCLEGCDIRVTVRIQPDAQNRLLTIEADSAVYFRSSEIQLSGDSAPLLHTLMLHSPPSGRYVVRATIVRANGVTSSSAAALRVVGPPERILYRSDL